MSVAQAEKNKSTKDIEDVISKAIKKIGVRKENELCKYLPMKSGGYMHHFTFKKMKHKQPQELASIIEKHLMSSDKAVVIAPKQRAPRGSRKRKDHMNFTRNQLERMLSIARLAGDKEIITILSPKRSLATCKRELIQSIRHNKTEQDLWTNYVEAANTYIQMLATDPLAAFQH
ncbi:MAG TPA: hypothetical protein VLE96_04490 [Chlamydiales bacterium]|nr:hypothetical protein [Chlamydiales bacterium]